MSITVIQSKDIPIFEAGNPYSINVIDEELLGIQVQIANKKSDSEYVLFSTTIQGFEEILQNHTQLTLVSDYSKAIYKQFHGLIEKSLIIQDINLASYINNGSGKHNLNALTDFFGLDSGLPDAIKMLMIFERWMDLLTEKAHTIWQIENKTARILAQMELDGIKIDHDKLLGLKKNYYEEAQKLNDQIKDILNSPNTNVNSNKQLGESLVAAGFKLGRPGKSGAPSIKESVLESILPKDTSGVIQKILDYRTVQKMYSTYTDSLLDRLDQNDRLHGEFNQTVAATGRLSSANPNLQNIPIRHPKYGSDLRSVFIAKPGYSLISADYSQIELRILAHLTQDPRLLQAFRNGEDIHSVTASEIFETPLSEVTKSQRSVGKTLNFALMYQQGYTSTAKQLGIPSSEAKLYHQRYFEKFAHIKPYIDSVLGEAEKTGFAETMYGRRAYYPELQSDQGFLKAYAQRAAFNMPIQGAEADIVKMAMIALDKNLHEQKVDCSLLLQIHDEIVFEVIDSELEKTTQLIKITMELGQPLTCPLEVVVHSGKNWNEAK